MGADQSKEPELAQLRNEVVELKSKLNGLMLLIAVVVPTATLAGYFICKAITMEMSIASSRNSKNFSVTHAPVCQPPSSDDPRLRCVVCLDRDKEILFAPCRHLCCCTRCSASLSTCPVCRTAISERRTVYFS